MINHGQNYHKSTDQAAEARDQLTAVTAHKVQERQLYSSKRAELMAKLGAGMSPQDPIDLHVLR